MSAAAHALAAINALGKASFEASGSGELFKRYAAQTAETLEKQLTSFRRTYELTKGKQNCTKLVASISLIEQLLPLTRQLEQAQIESRRQQEEARMYHAAAPSGANGAGVFLHDHLPLVPEAPHTEVRGGSALGVLTQCRQQQGAQGAAAAGAGGAAKRVLKQRRQQQGAQGAAAVGAGVAAGVGHGRPAGAGPGAAATAAPVAAQAAVPAVRGRRDGRTQVQREDAVIDLSHNGPTATRHRHSTAAAAVPSAAAVPAAAAPAAPPSPSAAAAAAAPTPGPAAAPAAAANMDDIGAWLRGFESLEEACDDLGMRYYDGRGLQQNYPAGWCTFTPGCLRVDRASFQRLKLNRDEEHSNSGFNFNLRLYSPAAALFRKAAERGRARHILLVTSKYAVQLKM